MNNDSIDDIDLLFKTLKRIPFDEVISKNNMYEGMHINKTRQIALNANWEWNDFLDEWNKKSKEDLIFNRKNYKPTLT